MMEPQWARKESLPQILPPLSNLTKPTSNGNSPSGPHGEIRDSGNWSMPSGHSSFSSHVTLPPIEPQHPRPIHPLHDSAQQPPPFSGASPFNSSSHPQSPTAAAALHNRSQASLHGHQHYPSQTSNPSGPSPSASRRSSFDARLGNLHLNSHDSHPSLPSLINRDRNIHNRSPGGDSLSRASIASSSNIGFQRPSPPAPISSLASPVHSHATPERLGVPGRIAPPITGPTGRFQHFPHPNAPSPTKGFPYAFPDPEIVAETIPEGEAVDARRVSTTSLAASSVSSIYSGHSSHMGHHLNSTPYSRTPELRISHKLAERKRRKEMKNLFDDLRDLLPSDRGGKSSKWEILTKAIEHIRDQRTQYEGVQREVDALRHQTHQQRDEIERLKQQMAQLMSSQPGGSSAPPPLSMHHSQNHHHHQQQPQQQQQHHVVVNSHNAPPPPSHHNQNIPPNPHPPPSHPPPMAPGSQGRMQGIEHY